MKVVVRITPECAGARHEVRFGPGGDDYTYRYFIGTRPYGPRGGTGGKAVDATEIVSCRGTSCHAAAQRCVYAALVDQVRRTGKPITISERVDAALARLSRVASVPNASVGRQIEIFAEGVLDVPAAYRKILRDVYGAALVNGAVKLARANAAERVSAEIGD